MASTLGPRPDSRKYRRQDAALGRFVSDGGSRTLAGAHQMELRTWARARRFIQTYAIPRALRAIEDLRSCISGDRRPVTPDRIQQAVHVDNLENAALARHLTEQTAASKEHLIRSLYAEAAVKVELARDLDAEAAR